MRLLALTAILFVLACSASATEDAPGIYALDADGDGQPDGVAGCFLCSGASCGMCMEEPAPSTYVCTSDRVPDDDCHNRGSLFDHGTGPYRCWYCQ